MEWSKIQDYNYSISIHGDVRNDKTGHILKPRLNRGGYYYVDLFKDRIGKHLSIHRLVALAFLSLEEGRDYVDHIDNDKTNNSINNLRWCSKKENGYNQTLSKKNKSGVKGVHFSKQRQKWHARITIDGKIIHIGYYKTLDEARTARQEKANEVFGVFTNACEQ
jgi:hypothetical protein